jgi:6-phosphogluconate dehydrogenase
MEIGLIGLGNIGGNMRERLQRDGHTVVGFDRNREVSDVGSLDDLVAALASPKIVWVMVPAGDPTRQTITALNELLGDGDIVIDGGNSRWTDDQAHATLLAEKGIGFVDCGVSGGVWGLDVGYALMCGGERRYVDTLMPIFQTLKPEGDQGFVHAGSVGAGHFPKMVHIGIE